MAVHGDGLAGSQGLDTFLAADGPADWQRVARGDTPQVKSEPQASVSNISTSDDGMSFDVSQTGVPMLVKCRTSPTGRSRVPMDRGGSRRT